jgi:hypothetical protein
MIGMFVIVILVVSFKRFHRYAAFMGNTVTLEYFFDCDKNDFQVRKKS